MIIQQISRIIKTRSMKISNDLDLHLQKMEEDF